MILSQRSFPLQIVDSVFSTLNGIFKLTLMQVLVLMITLSSVIITFEGFVEHWVWEPFWTLPIMWMFYIADTATAIIRTGRVNGTNWEFSSDKFQKFIVDVIGVTIVLGTVHAFPVIGDLMMERQDLAVAKREATYDMLILSTWGAYLAIAVRQGFSIVANASKAGVIPKGAAKVISKHLDRYKESIWDDTISKGK